MFAYGARYLGATGDVFLIYPRTTTFDAPLPVFEFSEVLRLWVVPFDLEAGQLMGVSLYGSLKKVHEA